MRGNRKSSTRKHTFLKNQEKKSLYDNENLHHGNPDEKPHRFVRDLLGIVEDPPKIFKNKYL